MSQTPNPLLHVTDQDFEQKVLNSELPVLVDFWAEWCGPCRILGPTIEELAQDYDGRVRVAKMDVDANNQTAAKYGIRSIPTVMVFDKGEVTDSLIGLQSKADYERSLVKVT